MRPALRGSGVLRLFSEGSYSWVSGLGTLRFLAPDALLDLKPYKLALDSPQISPFVWMLLERV